MSQFTISAASHEPPAQQKPILTLTETAERYGVPERTLYTWRWKGEGPPSFRVGKYVRYRLADLEAWEQEQITKEYDR